jgi:lysyl-tRNA synthetase class 1
MSKPTFTPQQYLNSNAWPFTEAKRVIAHMEEKAKAGITDKGYVLFETGYGPSGLPHIGTFGEVFRTTMVRHAFERLQPGVKTRLFAFSDDMDGLRKIPTNLPNQDLLKPHLGRPLTRIPDPFEKFESFAHHNNAMLRGFLDRFGFDYEFFSSTQVYASGMFDAALLNVLKHHAEICAIIVPTLGEERAATYSPFLPIDPQTGVVLQVPVVSTDAKKGTITYRKEDGSEVETEVTGGKVKLQWKADWAMRWDALGVDYEMCGKDLIDSVNLGSQICRTLGGIPPVNLIYEHFVDENGAKISKSKGNGLTIEEWLTYAPADSLSLYMYRTPTRAKKLYRSLIPTTVQEYADHLDAYPAETAEQQLENPVFHIFNGNVPANPLPFKYDMLLNLISVAASEDPARIWAIIQHYRPELSPENNPQLNALIEGAVRYYVDTIKPTQRYVAPSTEQEHAALTEATAYLKTLKGNEDAEAIQTEFYEIGKRLYSKETLRAYFKFLYQALLGYENGPRLGSFTKIYGVEGMLGLITAAQNRQPSQAA